jgi:hypothetical protein
MALLANVARRNSSLSIKVSCLRTHWDRNWVKNVIVYVVNQISCTEQINTGQLLGIGMLPASGVNECEKVNTNMVLRPNGKISSA